MAQSQAPCGSPAVVRNQRKTNGLGRAISPGRLYQTPDQGFLHTLRLPMVI
jgi:hypothetical protein